MSKRNKARLYLIWLLHKCGFHAWEYYNMYHPGQYKHNSIVGIRLCKLCGMMQHEVPHCLGMNPEKWITGWHNTTSESIVFVEHLVKKWMNERT